ncbi:MAG: hypothetical protein SFZ23_14550 [Planctomycetota bacterium]|nr:hypothetical protein [Planctomycetota bacterium]
MASLIEAILVAIGAYAAIGVAFALAFAFRGVNRVDEVARHAPLSFRLLIIPGAAALWPIMARRWLSAQRGLPASHGLGRAGATSSSQEASR